MSGNWLWRNHLTVDLPMRAAQHDPVNGKTLNVGRGGSTLDAAFGAGAAEPTKLSNRRGYSFDGADSMQIASYASVVGAWSVLITAQNDDTALATDYLVDVQTGRIIIGWFNSNTNLMFFDGAVTRTTSGRWTRADGGIHTVVLTNDGSGQYEFYIDGVNADSFAGTDRALGGDIGIGCKNSADANYLSGQQLHFGTAHFALTPTQVIQYHREMMKRINKV